MRYVSFRLFLLGLVLCSWQGLSAGAGNQVQVVEMATGHELLVNGSPFYIQGAGVGMAFGENGENYLAMAKELGANAVRTWGTDQGTREYLDEAHRQGLKVDAGLWLNYVDKKKTVSYIDDPGYLARKEKEVLDYVHTFKEHPAILLWNLGNEVIVFTDSEEERIAFCRFLEQLIQKVHEADPAHPVVYAAAGIRELPYLAQYVPSLDIIGINDYGSPLMVESRWKGLGFRIPYVITEFGPYGPWDLKKDLNGRFIESEDYTKAMQYRNYWSLVRERRGRNLGGFAFHLGETTQETLTCFNFNYKGYRKESFNILRKLYRGLEPQSHAPKIQSFKGVPTSLAAGESFDVTLLAKDPEGEKLTYEYKASTSIEGVLAYRVNSEVPIRVEGEGPEVKLWSMTKPGLYRIYAFVKDESGNIASTNRTLLVKEEGS